MQFTALLTLALATAVAAEGNNKEAGNKTLTTEQTCLQMVKLQKFVDFAANESAVATVTQNNATKIADLELKASDATAQLDTLKQNTTLMSTCAVVDAQAQTNTDCEKTFLLQKFVTFAANTTAVAAITNNNQTQMDALQAKASKAQTELQTLQSNTTLQAYCPSVQQADECKFMNGLQKFVDTANNQTKVDALTKGNATKAAEFQAAASQAADQLSAMTSNQTFVDACNALKATQDGTQSGTAAAASTSASSAASLFSSEIVFMSSVVAVAVGMMML